MFEGSAAQFLALMETLNDTNRRTLLTAPPAPDSDVEMLDVYAELFMAAQEIIAGKSLSWFFKNLFPFSVFSIAVEFPL